MMRLVDAGSVDDQTQVLKLTLDLVFDVAFEESHEVSVTRFSIAFDGQEVKDLILLGHVNVAALRKVKVLLARRGSWQSLLAIRDLETGHTHWNPATESSGCLLALLSIPLIYGVSAAIMYESSRNAWLLFAAFIAYGILAALIHTRRQAAILQFVREKLSL